MKRSLLALLLLITSCGYQFDTVSHVGRSSIYVPFAQGDHQGELTNQVVAQLAATGKFLLVPSNGRYRLDITCLDMKDQNVGFRYDTNEEGQTTHTLVPQETRTSLLVEVTLVDTYTNCIAIGPARVSASTVFDHEWYSSPNAINVFSLGQVNDYSDAKDNALIPLNRSLAQKIVDLLLNLY